MYTLCSIAFTATRISISFRVKKAENSGFYLKGSDTLVIQGIYIHFNWRTHKAAKVCQEFVSYLCFFLISLFFSLLKGKVKAFLFVFSLLVFQLFFPYSQSNTVASCKASKIKASILQLSLSHIFFLFTSLTDVYYSHRIHYDTHSFCSCSPTLSFCTFSLFFFKPKEARIPFRFLERKRILSLRVI